MFLKPIKAALLAAVVLLPAFTGWLVRVLTAPGPAASRAVLVEVERGRSARAVIEGLRDRGVVRSAVPLGLAYRFFYSAERFKAGEYEFTPPLKPKDVFLQVFQGRIYLPPITVPEGLTGREIAELFRPGNEEGQAAFARTFRDVGLIADWDPRAKDLEGYLFPNTYRLPRRAAEADLIAAMLAEFREVFDAGRRARAAELGLSVRDVVTLASLIEEETALPEERPLVSAVFHNRLRIGMKLDCDPTIVYALKLAGKYSGRLLLRDLKFPSPYNTYLHPGLPPGPISNPGKPAIDAALHPAPEPYLYFVAQGDGSHRFSRTLGEHLDAVRRYQKLKKK
jgi:UPF0755 protein